MKMPADKLLDNSFKHNASLFLFIELLPRTKGGGVPTTKGINRPARGRANRSRLPGATSHVYEKMRKLWF
jgi:hypothetical protein